MGLIRVVGVLVLLAACDKGKLEPAKGSAQPLPAPLPSPDPAPVIDAMSIDEQILNNTYNPDDHVLIRACNDTGKRMTVLEWHGGYKAQGLGTGACTAYEQTSRAYGYTYAKFMLGKDEFIIQPIDYVGETPLAPGRYSYHITIVDYGHRTANIRAKEDKP